MNKPVKCGCGGEPHLDFARSWNPEKEEWIPNFWHRVICRKCGTQTIAFYTEAEAIEAWNRAIGNRIELQMIKERTAKVEKSPLVQYSDEVYIVNSGHCECGALVFNDDRNKYCPMCGARLEWE